MKKVYYPIGAIIEDVAAACRGHADDVPMIRTAINDHLDAANKAGYQVRFDYDQPRAVKRVQKLIKEG